MTAQLPLMSLSHQDWHSWLHKELPSPRLKHNLPANDAHKVLDLFAGCGGMALGFEACGFQTVGYEMKPQAVKTYSHNLGGECHEVVLQKGVPEEEAEVIIGGPPCQPFSQHGFQRGKRDARDGFPIFLDAVRRIQPKIAIMENVRGLLYRNKDYLRQAVQQLEGLGYTVDVRLLKAVHYGVPQNRERVIVVASTVGWEWPEMTVNVPVTAGAALGAMAQEESPSSNYLTPNVDKYIAEYERKSHCVTPRDLHLDRPARTVTCRNLGAMTSDMLRLKVPSGKRRALTVREGARLQSFPDWFEFSGTTYEQCEQIGNAVPPLMGLALAKQVKLALSSPSIQQRKISMKSNVLSANSIEEKVEQALNILRQVGIPVRNETKRRQERLAKALLAVAHLKPAMKWTEASSHFVNTAKPVTTRDIIKFWNEHYGESIADASYDDVRRKDLVVLVEAGLVANSAADPTADVNDGTRGYAIPAKALALIQNYGGEEWEDLLMAFRQEAGNLSDKLSKARVLKKVPVKLPDGSRYKLEPGPHNQIQKAIVEEFLPRYSKGAEVLYIGDTSKKVLHIDNQRLIEIGIGEMRRGEMLPDIIAYEKERDWLFIIEAVHTSNPISKLRHLALRRLTSNVKAGCLFISAFEKKATFSRFSKEISWETDVWIADDPDHMIHFDGGRFLSPHVSTDSPVS